MRVGGVLLQHCIRGGRNLFTPALSGSGRNPLVYIRSILTEELDLQQENETGLKCKCFYLRTLRRRASWIDEADGWGMWLFTRRWRRRPTCGIRSLSLPKFLHLRAPAVLLAQTHTDTNKPPSAQITSPSRAQAPHTEWPPEHHAIPPQL